MIESPWQIVRASGNNQAFGIAYGTQARDLIVRATSAYREMLRGVPNVETMLDGFWATVDKHAPGLLNEMASLAKAAGVSLDDILLMNARSELITISRIWDGPSHECTSLGLERFTDGPLVAQNWDWLHEMKGQQIILHAAPEGLPAYVSFCEAGHMAKISINEHGLAVGLNFLHAPDSDRQAIQEGIPVHLLLRMVLAAKTVPDAIQILRDLPRGDGANIMMADAWGNVASVEISPSKVDVIKPLYGMVTHANDYEANTFPAPRSKRLRQVIGRMKFGTIGSPEDMSQNIRNGLFAALRDHGNGDEPICSHPLGMGTSASIVSIVMEPATRSLWAADGLPCACKAPVEFRVGAA